MCPFKVYKIKSTVDKEVDKMIFAYIRVSSKEQNPERQIQALKENEDTLEYENIHLDKESCKISIESNTRS